MYVCLYVEEIVCQYVDLIYIFFFPFQSDSHGINENSADAIQFVNIRVKATRPGVAEFLIRINALDFKSLQDRMLRPITILEGVNFNKSVIERFIEVFKDQVNLNPRYKTAEVRNLIDTAPYKFDKRFFLHFLDNRFMFCMHASPTKYKVTKTVP